MKHSLVLGSSLALVAVLGLTVAGVQAASARYTFTARGIVTHVDSVNETIKMDVTKAIPTKAFDDLEGNNIEFKVEDAKVYKYTNSTAKDKRVTFGNIAVGQELGVKGTAMDNDSYELNFVRIHDRSFTVVGLLKEHNETARTVKILVTTSTYKPATYKKGTEITMQYPEDATFYEKNTTTAVSFSVVDADDQKVKVTGTIDNSSTWKVKTLVDHYKGS